VRCRAGKGGLLIFDGCGKKTNGPTDGPESDQAASFVSYVSVLGPYRFIQIGPCWFYTLLDLIAVDLIPEMGLYPAAFCMF
jgi:hypothetical protein